MFSKSCTARPDSRDSSSEPASSPATLSYASENLFRGQKEICIVHQGFSYRLRITRTGGLILNK